MISLSRYLAPAVLAARLGVAAVAAPAPAQAQSDDLVRVLVDVADVVLRSGQPDYRYGDYGYDDRLVMQRDRYGRPVYYRYVPREVYRQGPPYGMGEVARSSSDKRTTTYASSATAKPCSVSMMVR